MATINFPTSPALNEEYTLGTRTWIWNGYAWDVKQTFLVANVSLVGDVLGTSNVILTPGTTNIAINTSIQPNSVGLGTDTTGNYTDRVIAGTGISTTGTGDEGNVITVGLTTTGVSATTYGNATIVPVITVDAQGRITNASNVTISFPASSGGGSNVFTYAGGANGNTITQTNSVPASINTTAFNFFAGQCAGSSITTGTDNIFLGERAGFCNTTGSYNFFAGKCAGGCNTTGDRNIFIGNTAGFCNTTGNNNTFIGAAVGYCNTTGVRNTAVGGAAGQYNTTGNDNTSLGYFAGCCNRSGSRNIFLGSSSGANVTTGNDNIIFGCLTSCAGFTQATSNVIAFATGGVPRFEIDSSLRNILIGTCAGNAITSGADNIFAGQCAGLSNTTGNHNNFFGLCAGLCNTTGNHNNFFGQCAGACNTSGGYNNFFGFRSGLSNTSGCYNNFFGRYAGTCNTTGCNNNFAGRCAGICNTSGGNNTFFGFRSGFRNTTGNNNNFFGQCAGLCNTSGTNNTYLGFNSGANITTGNDNIIFGCLTSCVGITEATSNVIILATSGTKRVELTPTLTVIGTSAVTSANIFGDLKFTNSFTEKIFTITDGAAVDLNPSNGTLQLWTLGASRTPTASSFGAGQSMTLMINDSASAFTVTWTTIGVVWVGGSAPSLLPASGNTVIELWKVGNTVYGALVGSLT